MYTTRVFQGSSVLDSIFWFEYIFAFYRSKNKIKVGAIDTEVIPMIYKRIKKLPNIENQVV